MNWSCDVGALENKSGRTDFDGSPDGHVNEAALTIPTPSALRLVGVRIKQEEG